MVPPTVVTTTAGAVLATSGRATWIVRPAATITAGTPEAETSPRGPSSRKETLASVLPGFCTTTTTRAPGGPAGRTSHERCGRGLPAMAAESEPGPPATTTASTGRPLVDVTVHPPPVPARSVIVRTVWPSTDCPPVPESAAWPDGPWEM